MNRKGFTIIELVTIIALLSIIGVVISPKIMKAIKSSNADQLEDIRQNIAEATDTYLNSSCGNDAHNILYTEDSVKIVLNSIVDCGLIKSKIVNPMNNMVFDMSDEYVIVNIDEVGLYDYKFSFDL